MIELAQLFQDMEAAVVQQEPAIEHIDNKAEDTVVHLDKGNQQLDQAVDKARSARRKKWICLGIVSKSITNPLNLCTGRQLTLASPHHYHHRRYRCDRGGSYQKMIRSPEVAIFCKYSTWHTGSFPYCLLPIGLRALLFPVLLAARSCGVEATRSALNSPLSASTSKSYGEFVGATLQHPL